MRLIALFKQRNLKKREIYSHENSHCRLHFLNSIVMGERRESKNHTENHKQKKMKIEKSREKKE